MGKASPAIAGFSAGEFSPQMEGRIDEAKYPVAAHIAQNFLILKQGPAQFRAGSAYATVTKNSANRSWLRRFEFSQTQAFLIEFGDKYVRFYTNHGPLLATGVAGWNSGTAYVLGNLAVQGGITYYCVAPNTNQAPPNATYWYALTNFPGGGAIYEIPSPYAAADLTDSLGEFTLQFEQSADVLYIAGGAAGSGPQGNGYPTYTLTRFANAPPNWQFAQYAPTDGPYADAAPLTPGTVISLGVSRAGPAGASCTVTAYGGNVFASTDVGRLVRIATSLFNITPWTTQTAFTAGATCTNNGNNYVALNSATTGGSPPVHTAGSALDGSGGVRWLYTDSGYGVAQITGYTDAQHVTANILVQFPAAVVASSAAVTGITQANPAVVTATQSFATGETVFLYGVGGMTQLNQNPYYSNQTASGTTVTLAGIDSTAFSAYTSGGTIVGNASWEWQLGSWSYTTEWPRTLALFKDRLFLRGKLQLWGSVTGLYTSHAPDTFGVQTTASAININAASTDASTPSWLMAALLLLDGTQGGEYGIDAANYSTTALGPANIEDLRQSNWRCRPIQPVMYGTTVLYVQRAGRKLFAMDYTLWLNRYDSTDQSKYAYHISVGGITAIASQQEPYAIIWAVRADGTLLSYTFNREDNVTAWARHNLGGGGIVESIAVIPAPDGLRDELWMIVNRTVNGAVVRTVEYFAKPYEGPEAGSPGDQQNSCWYVDCGLQYIAPPPPAGITNVTTARGGGLPGGYVTVVTVTMPNSFSAGQTVYVSGVQSTGTLNVNGAQQLTAATASSFTFVVPNLWTFAYVSGGTASLQNSPGGQTVITGIPAVLWNQPVAIFADGGVQPQQTVSSAGVLTVPGTFSVVTFGFPYQGNLVPMRFESQAVGVVGTTQGKVKKAADLVLRLVDTMGGIVGQLTDTDSNGNYVNPLGLTTINLQRSEEIQLNRTQTRLDSPPPILSGDVRVDFASKTNSDADERDLYVCVQQNDPCPMTVVGLFPRYMVSDPA